MPVRDGNNEWHTIYQSIYTGSFWHAYGNYLTYKFLAMVVIIDTRSLFWPGLVVQPLFLVSVVSFLL